MTYTSDDLEALYHVWMSQKARMHLTQMEVAKQLGLTQIQLSNILRGREPLTQQFVQSFCRYLHVDPYLFMPSLIQQQREGQQQVKLVNRVIIDGDIDSVYVDGNQVVIEYRSAVR
ncbi:helix-turn-helix transcriptional regulator [Vibrio ruber]|uniref:HTH cro/C1-type domain-containing protein n=1 Tax=Vibrio ruber (strain DSM 16370 / JCM 11486 / BCRC 17186 / CECT 7878 / LMG 23124 / VR1) TaxID=1123498 RepID=A0A1R4LFH6_VIBR1|nr:helix-turn-helix transcriptional regulator [Vibrio ruber]WNJ97906.1 helix-turn-helix transcriptional regulator [Vibrio ruber]SJN55295.1 hypothetical protein VR7878_01176 [Vibrio ruber DSM 16370]